nr:hypothetical protein [Tanacetum cinerariifolium]
MRYEKPSDKLTFYKAFFFSQWKFLIHTILQCLSAKTTSWNEFSSTMASAIIYLSTNEKFNFSRDVTLLFDNMLVQASEKVGILQADAEPIPIPTEPLTSKPQKKHKPKRKHTKEPEVPPTKSQAKHNVPLPSPSHDPLPSARKQGRSLEDDNRVLKELKGVHSIVYSDEPVMEKEESFKQRMKISDIDADVEINLEKVQAKAYNLDLDHQERVLSMLDVNDEELADVEEVVDVVTIAKLITKVVTTTGVDVNAASVQDTSITSAEATKVIVEVPKLRKRIVQIDLDEEVARQLEVELNADIDWNVVIEQVKRSERLTYAIRPLFEKHYNYNQAFLNELNEGIKVPEKEVKQEKQVEVESSKREDATPLASNIPIVDYKIHTERNRPYFKIIRADGNHSLFISFSIMMKNFDREDLESLWKIVRERFEKTEAKNYTYDYLLNTLKIMFEKPNVEASVWKDQKGKYGLAKVKSWKLFESCGVHCLNLSTIQMLLFVEKMYPLTHFTIEQLVNDFRLEVEYESEMSLELLRLVIRHMNECLCFAMCHETPVISAGFQANTSRLRLKGCASGSETIVYSSGIILLLRRVSIPPWTGYFSIPGRTLRDFLLGNSLPLVDYQNCQRVVIGGGALNLPLSRADVMSCKGFLVFPVGNKMLKAFPLPMMSSHCQKKFPLLVRKVPFAEE